MEGLSDKHGNASYGRLPGWCAGCSCRISKYVLLLLYVTAVGVCQCVWERGGMFVYMREHNVVYFVLVL